LLPDPNVKAGEAVQGRSREREREKRTSGSKRLCAGEASSPGQGAGVTLAAVQEEEQAGVEMGCLGGAGVRRRGDAKNVRGVRLRARGERGGGVGGHPVQCIPTLVLFANERRGNGGAVARRGWGFTASASRRMGTRVALLLRCQCECESACGAGGDQPERNVRRVGGRERPWKWAVWVGRGWRRRQRKTSLAFACHGASHTSAHGPCEKAPHVLIECNLGLPPI
jgi:hypothetical protein